MSDHIENLVNKGKLKEAESKLKFMKTDQGFQEVKPFVRYKSDEAKEKEKSITMTIRLNKEESQMLEDVKKAIKQPKDSTAFKKAFILGAFDVLHDQKTKHILDTIFKNKRNNERSGRIDFE